jgi:MFS transporter, MHS family, shikimate and dehydroshikimate transport protein
VERPRYHLGDREARGRCRGRAQLAAAGFGTLASLATFSVGFIARPIGGAIFGYFGDRMGRKVMLMITMVIMALATFAVGCLPTYQEIGVWAPILLVMLRFTQGICVGGDWGGVSLMVIEHAPAARRGLFGSLVQIGAPSDLWRLRAYSLWRR